MQFCRPFKFSVKYKFPIKTAVRFFISEIEIIIEFKQLFRRIFGKLNAYISHSNDVYLQCDQTKCQMPIKVAPK